MEAFSVTPAGRKITITPQENQSFNISIDEKYIGNIYPKSHSDEGVEWISDNGVLPSLINLAGRLIEERYM